MNAPESYDVVVIGGGPAGLAGALWLARYRCNVILFDAEDPRNAEKWAVHGYLGREEVPPFELRRIGREQAAHAGARLETALVQTVEGAIDDFRVALVDGREVRARRLLVCTGLKDIIPEIPGLPALYGSSVWHCPDCDGPSVVGQRVGVIGWGRSIAAFCMWMLTWTDRLTLLTHGHDPELPPDARAALERFSIPVETRVIDCLEGEDGALRTVRFDDGGELPLDGAFFHVASGPGSSFAASLGCETEEGAEFEGILKVDPDFQTNVPGVFAAGDITPGTRLAIRAAADGTRAAIGIQRSLVPPERRLT